MSPSTGTIPANRHIQKWVKDVAAMCQPDEVFWCDGSEDEKERLTEIAVHGGDLIPLNQKELPGCYLHRSALNDVARTENLTFVCTESRKKRAPTIIGWRRPNLTISLSKIYAGSMRGRTLYVIPFLMGPAGSSFQQSRHSSHGQRLCRAQHALNDAHGQDRARSSRRLRRLYPLSAFQGRPRHRAPLHLSLPSRQYDLERRLGLRRQCVAGKKMSRARASPASSVKRKAGSPSIC